MTLDHLDKPEELATGLGLRLLLHWRIRCAALRIPIDTTAGPLAARACTSVIRTLDTGGGDAELARDLDRWQGELLDDEAARAAADCLVQLVAEIAAEVFEEFPPAGLGVVLERLAEHAAARRPAPLAQVDARTGCLGPDELETRLDSLVPAALAAGGDVSVAVVEFDEKADADLRVAAALREATYLGDNVYRTGRTRFVVVSAGRELGEMRQLALHALCLADTGVRWGASSLATVGLQASETPDVLVMMAEADLHLRRQDFAAAEAVLARRRRTTVGALAASVALLAGLAGAMGTTGAGAPTGATAQRAPHVSTVTTTPPPASTQGTTPATAPPAPSTPPPSDTQTLTVSGNTPQSPATVTLTSATVPTIPAATTPPPSTPTPGNGQGNGGGQGHTVTPGSGSGTTPGNGHGKANGLVAHLTATVTTAVNGLVTSLKL